MSCYLLLRGRRVGGDAAACGRRAKRVVDMAALSARARPRSRTIDLLMADRRVWGTLFLSHGCAFFSLRLLLGAPTTGDISASSSPWICGSLLIMSGVDYGKGHTEFVGLM